MTSSLASPRAAAELATAYEEVKVEEAAVQDEVYEYDLEQA